MEYGDSMLTVVESQVVLPMAGLVVEVSLPVKRTCLLEAGCYGVRLAVTESDRLDATRLRFIVFNLELHEGLMSAYADGLDRDRFDDV
jgi:putative hemolysin